MNTHISATKHTIDSISPKRTSRPLITSLGTTPFLMEDIHLFIEDIRHWFNRKKKTVQK